MHYHQDTSTKHQFRCWLHYGKRQRRCARLEINWWSRFCFLSVARDDEDGLGFSVALPPVAVWFSPGFLSRGREDRALEVRVHNTAIWWKLWTKTHEWSSKTPKWREGSFHFDDFLLGRPKCQTKVLEERDVLVPMPEKAYPAKAKLMLYEWRRPRWFTKRMKRAEIEIPGGIPFEGKGESSWNCGPDATHSMTTGECNSIPEGVGILVGSMLHTRVRYGGWKDWSWQREAVQ